ALEERADRLAIRTRRRRAVGQDEPSRLGILELHVIAKRQLDFFARQDVKEDDLVADVRGLLQRLIHRFVLVVEVRDEDEQAAPLQQIERPRERRRGIGLAAWLGSLQRQQQRSQVRLAAAAGQVVRQAVG